MSDDKKPGTVRSTAETGKKRGVPVIYLFIFLLSIIAVHMGFQGHYSDDATEFYEFTKSPLGTKKTIADIFSHRFDYFCVIGLYDDMAIIGDMRLNVSAFDEIHRELEVSSNTSAMSIVLIVENQKIRTIYPAEIYFWGGKRRGCYPADSTSLDIENGDVELNNDGSKK